MAKKRRLILLAAVGLAIVSLLVFLRVGKRLGQKPISPVAHQQPTASRVPSAQSPTASSSILTNSTPRSAALQEKRFIDAFATPIAFYGRVIDQHGEPVAEADVKLSANDKAFGGRPSEYVRKSDADGRFTIQGIAGITLAVEVSKPGYRTIPPADNKVTSSGLFEYSVSEVSVRGAHRPDRTRRRFLFCINQGRSSHW